MVGVTMDALMDVPLIFWNYRFNGGSQSGEYNTWDCDRSSAEDWDASVPAHSFSGTWYHQWGIGRSRSSSGHFWMSAAHGRMQ